MWFSEIDIQRLPVQDQNLTRAMLSYGEAFQRGASQDELDALRAQWRREFSRRWPGRPWPGRGDRYEAGEEPYGRDFFEPRQASLPLARTACG